MLKYCALSAFWLKPVLLVTILLPTVLAANEPDVDWVKLGNLAGRYLAACSSPEAVKALNQKLEDRVAQRVTDSSVLKEDSALRAMMLDWAVDNEVAITNREPKAVTQACVYLIAFLDKGYTLPEQFRSRMTPEVVNEISAYLEGEIAFATSQPGHRDASAVAKAK